MTPDDLDRAQPDVTRALRLPALRAALHASAADAATLMQGGAALARGMALAGDPRERGAP